MAGEPRHIGLIPLMGLMIPVIGALASLYLMTNNAYTKAVALESKVSMLESENRTQEIQIRTICSALIEVETQFRSADQTRNIMHANDMRVEAMLWKKTFGVEYPTANAYYPTIAQDKPQPCG